MLKGMNSSFYDFAEHPLISGMDFTRQRLQYNDGIDDEIYGTDEFRMYAYKIKRCSRTRSHDWTECPYAHRGEKAQRRDPRKVPYIAITCPAFRKGKCPKGDSCEFAHGVFEYWLHPARYRTRACNAGMFCQRKVCFFAHSPDQLRSESKYKCHFTYKGRSMNGGDQQQLLGNNKSTGDGQCSIPCPLQLQAHHDPSTCAVLPYFSSRVLNREQYRECGGLSDILKRVKTLKMMEDEKGRRENLRNGGGGFEVSDSDLPHLDWISELVK